MKNTMRDGAMTLGAGDLPGRTGRGVGIAVVDSGVHAEHPHIHSVAGGVAFDAAGREHHDYVDRLGHGTAVAAVIRERAPAADVWAVKVFDRHLATTADALVAAIGWAADHGLHLVNLSLGTVNVEHEAPLARALAAAHEAGVVVVAAGPQPEARWLPGSLPGAVAVELDWTLARDACAVVAAGPGGLRLRASGYPRPIPGVSPDRNLKGLSFAVANATALLALALEGAPRGGDLRALLEGIA